MNFTKELPTKPGVYLWRKNETTEQYPTLVNFEQGRLYAWGTFGDWFADELGGEWCRLVPAEEIRLAWGVWAKARIAKLERDVRELKAELREVERSPTGNQEDSEWSIGV